ncbi:MAG: hypothetical protein RI906_1076 [Pseudomonadota bacterium]|jgi:hypothetical protein
MRTVRIGGASGFWGDTALAPEQLVRYGDLQYLVFDYLAELTLSIMAAQRARDAGAGYASDFITITMKSLLGEIRARGIRVVSNAGGMNPLACRDALQALAAEQGIKLRIGVVMGDDQRALIDTLRARDAREMQSTQPLPARVTSANAYLGAVPIACALDEGCDVVITGRCVDSAVTLGLLMHEFGWDCEDLNLLAQGTLAGHLIECGAQCTGGLFTDWDTIPDWPQIGFPIAEVREDGVFDITKPPGTGGRISVQTVAEQLLYEIADPRAYVVPDVTCDFTQVRIEAAGDDRVQVSGARGFSAPDTLKLSITYMDGYRNTAFLVIAGDAAASKARRTAQAIFARVNTMLAAHGMPALSETHVEVLGAEDMYGEHARADSREVVLKMAARCASRDSLELFAREFAPAATSMSPGTCGLVGGRPTPTPVIRLFSCLIPRTDVSACVHIDDQVLVVADAPGSSSQHEPLTPALNLPEAPEQAVWQAQHAQRGLAVADSADELPESWVEVPLIRLALGRSGDKGDTANIGIIVRRPEYLSVLSAWLTPARVAAWFAHRHPTRVERFDLPGIGAMNFVLHGVLGGGGMASLHTDALAKAYAQILLSMPVRVSRTLHVDIVDDR